jgi:hypothetical protein
MCDAHENHHFLSILKPAFTENAGNLVFRPYLSGSWGKVTFRECGAHLAVVASLRGKQWSNFGFKVGDVVGVW